MLKVSWLHHVELSETLNLSHTPPTYLIHTDVSALFTPYIQQTLASLRPSKV